MRKLPFISLLVLGFSLLAYLSSGQIINTIAGNGANGYSGDGGPATIAELNFNVCIALDDSGNIYVADDFNNRIRKVTLSTGIISTVAGGGFSSNNGDGGAATNAELVDPQDIAFDKAGNMYIADFGENEIRKVTASTGIITTIAGDGYIDYFMGLPNGWGGYSGNNGQATNAELNGPEGVAIDDSNNIYIADENNNVIRKVTALTGVITNAAGNAYNASRYSYGGGFSGNGGAATNAELNAPVSVAIDSTGNIYIADILNNEVREVLASTGIINAVAGTYSGGYTGDGAAATDAELFYPSGVSLDAFGNIYIADLYNNVIRLVTKSTGIISTIAGNGYLAGTGYGSYSGDGGQATSAELNGPEDVIVDASGDMYISDDVNNRIRKVAPDTNTVTTTNQLVISNGKCTIFPNPSNGVFNLYLSNLNEKCNLEVLNYLGENIYTAKINSVNTEINLSEQPDGVYFYCVISESEELVGEGKVVIEH